MDYLRTLGSAAVSSLVQKSGLNLPFSLGQRVWNDGIWTLYDATRRDDGAPVSVFEFDTPLKGLLPLAKNALRKLRVTRHPDVLKFMDAVETDTTVYIMTERVRPLQSELQNLSTKNVQDKQDWLLWGLHRITTALAFVNESCNSTHGNLRVNSIFLTSTGEWKLGGFEVLSSPNDEAAVLYTFGGLRPYADSIASPEVQKSGWLGLKQHPTAAADSYALALLIHSLFNPTALPPPTMEPPHPPPQPSSRGAIPPVVFPSFKKLLNPNPKPRMTAKLFLDVGMAESLGEGGGFFKDNRLLKICQGFESFGLMSEGERIILLRTIKEVAPTLPVTFATNLVLPFLLETVSNPAMASSGSTILPLAIQLGKNVSPEEYTKTIIEPVIKLFASPDRGTRMALLDILPEFADKLDKQTVSNKVWPHLQTGFMDTVPVIREATVKSIGLLSGKFNDRILNNDLLRQLARLQSDPEASIRTNTCILIGRLGPTLGYHTKRKVLVMAFAKALKDDFVHARAAGVMGFMACVDCFDIEELASRVVGTVAAAVVDKEKLVRDQALKAVEMFMKKLEVHAATMPETALTGDDTPNPLGAFTAATNGQTTLASSAAGAAGALAGWAISSIGKKIAPGDMHSAITPASSIPPPRMPLSSRPTTVVSAPATPSASSAPTKLKGMRLTSHKSTLGDLPAELIEETSASWADGDLMDVNADEDDWSAFASALDGKEVNAIGLGFEDVSEQAQDDDDPWGSMDGSGSLVTRSAEPPSYSKLSTQPARRPTAPASSQTTTLSPPHPLSSNHHSSRTSSPKPPDQDARTPSPVPPVAVSTAGMTKEEKAAEMTRRKEERKQRIAQLKEQKKNVASAKS